MDRFPGPHIHVSYVSLPAVVVIFHRPPTSREKAPIGSAEDAAEPARVAGALGGCSFPG
jgi:hypothetical protein